MHKSIAKLDRQINLFLKNKLPFVHAVLRRISIIAKRLISYQEANSCHRRHKPLRDRMHLAALTRVMNLKGEAVEVGVLTGYFSELILLYSDLSCLHSIDPWIEFIASDYDDSQNSSQEEMDQRYRFTQERLKRYGERSKIHRMTSMQAAPMFADNSLDFIYIDANHSYKGCMEDMRLWWPKLKEGGLFAGHDYLEGQLPGGDFGVKRAVDEFVEEQGQHLYVIPVEWPSWYVIKELKKIRL